MKNIIGYATGSIWRWLKTKNRNELIDYIRPLNPKAIELTIGSKEELFSLDLSDRNIKWLQTRSFVSIHSPAFHLTAPTKDEQNRQWKLIENIASTINAKTVVVHSEDLLSSELLKSTKVPISIENTGPDSYSSPEELNRILSQNCNLRFCLDLAHAALVSEQETEILIKHFSHKLSHFHLSGTVSNCDHQSLIGASSQFYKSLIPALTQNAPFMIEEDIVEKNTLILQREYEAADKIVNQRRIDLL